MTIPKKWEALISEKTMLDLRRDIGVLYENTICYPPQSQIFRSMEYFDPEQTNVVIIGQDPYPGLYKGQPSACGLAFMTENGYINPSLRLIFEELHDSKYHKVYKPHHLMNWVEEGVLLLNTSLSVEGGKPGSHIKVWKNFTKELITQLGKNKEIVWLLMGNHAMQYEPIIQGSVIPSCHPMAQQYSGGVIRFVGSGIFRDVNDKLLKLNKSPIEWNKI